MIIYKMSVLTNNVKAQYFFREHPTKENISDLLRRIWIKLSQQSQDNAWELILLPEQLPKELLILGTIDTIFGVIHVEQIGVIENGICIRD